MRCCEFKIFFLCSCQSASYYIVAGLELELGLGRETGEMAGQHGAGNKTIAMIEVFVEDDTVYHVITHSVYSFVCWIYINLVETIAILPAGC